MERKKLVDKVYQSGHLLTMGNKEYHERVISHLEDKLKKDIGKGDVTTETLIDPIQDSKAIIWAKRNGIIAGLEEVQEFYIKHKLKVEAYCKDGDHINQGDALLLLQGKTQKLLTMERTGLNFLQMMSGIATNTSKYVEAVQDYDIPVAATRKEWGDELLEKKAVFVGGGYTHRLGLYGFKLVKDNHLIALKNSGIENPIDDVIEETYKSSYYEALEIEVTSKEDAFYAAHKFKEYNGLSGRITPIIMLDNMSPDEMAAIAPEIRRYALIEASGNVNLDNIRDYARTGIDVISTSKLNCDVRRLDLSQDILLVN